MEMFPSIPEKQNCHPLKWQPLQRYPTSCGRENGERGEALTAWYKRASVAGSNKDGNPLLFSPAASLRSLPWEIASDAQVLQARENDRVKATGLGSWVQRQKLLSGEKCRGLGGAVTQTAVIFQTREMLAR